LSIVDKGGEAPSRDGTLGSVGASIMNRHPRIASFVRHTLGCGCPDEVLDEILHDPSHTAADGGPQVQRILVKDRLLIYVWATDDVDDAAARLETLMEAGRRERDSLGLNRFRAVIATGDIRAMHATTSPAFDRLPGLDERMHLHVVPAQQVAAWAN
jgi:hypothetical protein